MNDVTQILSQIESGDPAAAERLLCAERTDYCAIPLAEELVSAANDPAIYCDQLDWMKPSHHL